MQDETALREAAAVAQLPNLDAEGVFTHFSVSDTPGEEEYTAAQLALFLSPRSKSWKP